MRWLAVVVGLVTLAPGAHADVDDGLPPHPTAVLHHTAGPWIMFGSGMTLLIAAMATEYAANVGDSSGSLLCVPHCEQPPLTIAFQDAGWIGIAVGATLAITGVAWHFLERTTVSISPAVGGATVHITF